MNTYPTFPQWKDTAEDPIDDLTVDTSVNGISKARRWFSTTKRRFLVKHQLSIADLATLRAFYAANVTSVIAFVFQGDGETYSCFFEAAPKPKYLGNGYADVEVHLREQ